MQLIEENPMDSLVSTRWLEKHLKDGDLVILDCTVHSEVDEKGGITNISGRKDYESAHIPGAGFADLMGPLRDHNNNSLDFALPSPEAFCDAMGRLGVGNNTRVVLYDTFASMWAARVWWMLHWVGFDRAAILDGGFHTWMKEGRPVSDEPATYVRRKLTPNMRPEVIANIDDVREAINDFHTVLIDTFDEPHYRGEQVFYGRAGHIPGAMNIPAMSLINETGKYLAEEDLEAIHTGDKDLRYITYCGGGIMASGSAFLMSRIGYKDVAVYIGSLQEWAADAANPLIPGLAASVIPDMHQSQPV